MDENTDSNNSGMRSGSKVGGRGISSIKRGAFLGIISIIVGIPLYFIDLIYIHDITGIIDASFYPVKLPANAFIIYDIFIIFTLLAFILYIMSIINYRRGFRDMMAVDKRFSGPYSFSKYIIIFLFIIIIAMFFLLLNSSGVFRITVAPPVTGFNIGAVIAMLVLAIIVMILSIMSLIGVIYLIIGLFRFSEMHNQSIGEIGAIFYIIPFVDMLAPIFIYIGASRVEKSEKSE